MVSFLANQPHLQELVDEAIRAHSPETEIEVLVAACMQQVGADSLDSDTDGEYKQAFREIIASRREPEITQMGRAFRDERARLIREARSRDEERSAPFRATYHVLWNFKKSRKGQPLPRVEFRTWFQRLSGAARELSFREGDGFFPKQDPTPAGRLLRLPRKARTPSVPF